MDQQEIDRQIMIEQIIAQLDSSTADGVGHLNVHVRDAGLPGRTVETLGCTDCAAGDMACCTPTLHLGMDHE